MFCRAPFSPPHPRASPWWQTKVGGADCHLGPRGGLYPRLCLQLPAREVIKSRLSFTRF